MANARARFIRDVGKLAGELYDKAQAHIDREAARVRGQALGAVRSILEQSLALPETIEESSEKVLGGGRDEPRRKSGGGVIVCSKCGFVGANARGCGKTHNVQGDGVTAPKVVRRPDSKITGRAQAILERTRAARGDLPPPIEDEDDE